MNTVFQIVHVHRNKEEHVVSIARTRREIDFIVESPRYVGTWINDKRKLLRYGLGEIHIREVFMRPTVVNHAFEEVDGRMTVLLNINYDNRIDWIRVTESSVAGYMSLNEDPVWQVSSIPRIMVYTDKDVAYKCMQLYEKLLVTYKLEGAM